jgi:mono/diheme cytochrome c family protein
MGLQATLRKLNGFHLALIVPTLLVGLGGLNEETLLAGSRQTAKRAPSSKAALKPSSNPPKTASTVPQDSVKAKLGAAPVASKMDYARDVKPLLDTHCAACHGNGMKLGGFQMDSRETILKGGQSGPAVVMGGSSKSLLIKLVMGQVPNKIMPASGPRLTEKEIAVLRAWIDGGLKGNEPAKPTWQPILEPRHVKIPNPALGSGLTNPIDLLLQSYFKANKVQPRPVVSDRVYARRAYLDLIGMLPAPEEMTTFLNDKRSDRRSRLVHQLLSDNRRYAEHWLTFWNDMLRNDYAGTGYIDGGRTQITDWLYNALASNMPYDEFVRELVNPTPESAGFINGIVWRGVVNASQTPQMQASQNISQVFMGVNMKCASCHNSFISSWKLADSYGMAAIYADQKLELVRCDKPTGEIATVKFMYPELGAIDANAPKTERMAQLAKVITSKTNGRLARTLVNRLWTKLMGRGLIEPNDEMDNPPWNADLLDWLAADFQDHGYDIKRTMELIATSRAYQLPSMGLKSEGQKEFVFTGPAVKRMSAEQYVDAISTLTDVWMPPARSPLLIVKGEPVLPAGSRAKILFKSDVLRSDPAQIDVDVTGAEMLSLMVIGAKDDGSYNWADWGDPQLIGPNGTIKLTDLKWKSATTGYGKVEINQSVVQKPIRLGGKTYPNGIGTHADSVITYLLPKGVTRFRATAGPDTNGVEEGKNVTAIRVFVLTGDRTLSESRAALAQADPLMRALGRPNREQVVTERATAATTLQALELTNGTTLADMLSAGAEKWTSEHGSSPASVVSSLYETALGRPPTPQEKQAASTVIGSPVKKEGVEDLLWVMAMLPEFQLIY